LPACSRLAALQIAPNLASLGRIGPSLGRIAPSLGRFVLVLSNGTRWAGSDGTPWAVPQLYPLGRLKWYTPRAGSNGTLLGRLTRSLARPAKMVPLLGRLTWYVPGPAENGPLLGRPKRHSPRPAQMVAPWAGSNSTPWAGSNSTLGMRHSLRSCHEAQLNLKNHAIPLQSIHVVRRGWHMHPVVYRCTFVLDGNRPLL
jgi:hypothetical protein